MPSPVTFTSTVHHEIHCRSNVSIGKGRVAAFRRHRALAFERGLDRARSRPASGAAPMRPCRLSSAPRDSRRMTERARTLSYMLLPAPASAAPPQGARLRRLVAVAAAGSGDCGAAQLVRGAARFGAAGSANFAPD